MADDVDIDTDRQQEQIEEKRRELGRKDARKTEGGRPRWLDALAVSTALFAVFAAIAALESGNYANEALYKANQARRTDRLKTRCGFGDTGEVTRIYAEKHTLASVNALRKSTRHQRQHDGNSRAL